MSDTVSTPTIRDIPDLLRDAELATGSWDWEARELRLRFICLRKSTNGSDLADRDVELRLVGVRAIIVAYDCTWNYERPSELSFPAELNIESLSPWPVPSVEAWMSINSKVDAESIELAARTDSLLGDLFHGRESKLRICLGFELGIPRIPVKIWVGCDKLEPLDGGSSLDLQLWADQYAAWWQGWEQHWVEKPDHEPDIERPPVEEDKFIPSSSKNELDRSYAPPDEPRFALGVSDAPEELLRPLRDWFESAFEEDWPRLAKAYPDIDASLEDQIARIAARVSDEFGCWGYAREVRGWWVEGRRAHVRILGVKHYMPMDDEPAENLFEQWDFGLRLRGGDWQIHTHSEGRPDDTPKGGRWIQTWQSGSIK